MASTENLVHMQKILSNARFITAPECHVDVSELAKILQALNFRVKSSGEVAPSVAEECGGEIGGLTITVTCRRSRQQVVLERDADGGCTCVPVDEARGSWEVTAVTSGSRNSLVEATSGAYPPLEADAAATVRRLMECVTTVVDGRVPQSLPMTSTPFVGARRMQTPRLSLGAADDKHVARLSLGADDDKHGMLSSRYRSLDTLISTDPSPISSGLPQPGPLSKPPSQVKLSTDVCKAKSASSLMPPEAEERSNSPQRSTIPSSDVLSCLLTVQENVNRAIAMCKQGTTADTSAQKPQVFECKPSITTKSRIATNSRVVVRPVTEVIAPAASKVATVPAEPKMKKAPISKKYAHIKSTIPKPSGKY